MPIKKQEIKKYFEQLYHQYNRYEYIFTDPVLFLHTHADTIEYELSGLIASSLAYGRVAQILKSIRKVLDCVSLTPECLLEIKSRKLITLFAQYRHRFTSGEEICSLLLACKRIYRIHGSLQNCFLSHYKDTHTTYVPALTGFVKELKSCCGIKKSSLLPDPEKKSACKRLHLYLRWMVRRDAIDPGPWSGLPAQNSIPRPPAAGVSNVLPAAGVSNVLPAAGVSNVLPASKLIIPLDTHMHRIARTLGFTKRKQAGIKTAIEITEQFKKINPDDPVKYDFALTRMGMSGSNLT